MKSKWIAVLTAALCLGLGSEAAAQKKRPHKPGALFAKYDTNKDQKLSQSEVPAKLWARISKFDKDQDNAVSKRELAAARKGKGKNPRKGNGRIARIFRRLDKNKDRKLTQAEVPAKLWARISKFDADKDGAITPKELAAARKKRRKKI